MLTFYNKYGYFQTTFKNSLSYPLRTINRLFTYGSYVIYPRNLFETIYNQKLKHMQTI